MLEVRDSILGLSDFFEESKWVESVVGIFVFQGWKMGELPNYTTNRGIFRQV